MKIVGIDQNEQDAMFRIVAAILHLQNIVFAQCGEEKSRIENDFPLNMASKLLGMDKEALNHALTTRTRIVPNHQPIIGPISKRAAEDARDALSKSLYNSLFNWIIWKINQRICAPKYHSFIALLDIFGFERFQLNSFEQLCINYANEALQSHYNTYTFSQDLKECAEEGIDISSISFNDNGPCIDLIQGKIGILSILDEQSTFPKATDKTFVEKLKSTVNKNAHFSANPTTQEEFIIKHYAGEVEYNVGQWLEKNRDQLKQDLVDLIASSNDTFIASLAPQKTKQTTLSQNFKKQLEDLNQVIHSTKPHWVRCIKPNRKKVPNQIDLRYALDQMRSSGVLETIRIRREGYPVRMTFKEFTTNYAMLLDAKNDGTPALCKKILAHVSFDASKGQIGKSKVLMRQRAFKELEHMRHQRVLKATLEIQRITRGFVARKQAEAIRVRLEQERLERERLERERIERERLEAERLERERIEREKRQEEERLERERLERERLEREEAERKERERLEQIRLEEERERLEKEKAAQEQLEKLRKENEQMASRIKELEAKLVSRQQQTEQLRVKYGETELEIKKVQDEKAEAERLERERLEQEQLEKEKAQSVPEPVIEVKKPPPPTPVHKPPPKVQEEEKPKVEIVSKKPPVPISKPPTKTEPVAEYAEPVEDNSSTEKPPVPSEKPFGLLNQWRQSVALNQAPVEEKKPPVVPVKPSWRASQALDKPVDIKPPVPTSKPLPKVTPVEEPVVEQTVEKAPPPVPTKPSWRASQNLDKPPVPDAKPTEVTEEPTKPKPPVPELKPFGKRASVTVEEPVEKPSTPVKVPDLKTYGPRASVRMDQPEEEKPTTPVKKVPVPEMKPFVVLPKRSSVQIDQPESTESEGKPSTPTAKKPQLPVPDLQNFAFKRTSVALEKGIGSNPSTPTSAPSTPTKGFSVFGKRASVSVEKEPAPVETPSENVSRDGTSTRDSLVHLNKGRPKRATNNPRGSKKMDALKALDNVETDGAAFTKPIDEIVADVPVEVEKVETPTKTPTPLVRQPSMGMGFKLPTPPPRGESVFGKPPIPSNKPAPKEVVEELPVKTPPVVPEKPSWRASVAMQKPVEETEPKQPPVVPSKPSSWRGSTTEALQPIDTKPPVPTSKPKVFTPIQDNAEPIAEDVPTQVSTPGDAPKKPPVPAFKPFGKRDSVSEEVSTPTEEPKKPPVPTFKPFGKRDSISEEQPESVTTPTKVAVPQLRSYLPKQPVSEERRDSISEEEKPSTPPTVPEKKPTPPVTPTKKPSLMNLIRSATTVDKPPTPTSKPSTPTSKPSTPTTKVKLDDVGSAESNGRDGVSTRDQLTHVNMGRPKTQQKKKPRSTANISASLAVVEKEDVSFINPIQDVPDTKLVAPKLLSEEDAKPSSPLKRSPTTALPVMPVMPEGKPFALKRTGTVVPPPIPNNKPAVPETAPFALKRSGTTVSEKPETKAPPPAIPESKPFALKRSGTIVPPELPVVPESKPFGLKKSAPPPVPQEKPEEPKQEGNPFFALKKSGTPPPEVPKEKPATPESKPAFGLKKTVPEVKVEEPKSSPPTVPETKPFALKKTTPPSEQPTEVKKSPPPAVPESKPLALKRSGTATPPEQPAIPESKPFALKKTPPPEQPTVEPKKPIVPTSKPSEDKPNPFFALRRSGTLIPPPQKSEPVENGSTSETSSIKGRQNMFEKATK
jgi:hypothetical protein